MTAVDTLRLLRERAQKRFFLVDVGARWGVSERWLRLEDEADILCFEPDASECERLNTGRSPNIRYLPYALAERSVRRDLYMTAEPACSSLHRPIEALYKHYPPLAITKPEKIISVSCQKLDRVLAKEGVTDVAAIKLDTQGSELAILRGSKRALKACRLIDIEVEFNPLYQNQGLFCDIDRFLRNHGFVLWRLENLVHYAPEATPLASSSFLIATEPSASVVASIPNGQIFWAQAQYVRATYPRTGADWLPMQEACTAAALAGLYGFWDLALELIRKTKDEAFLRIMRESLA